MGLLQDIANRITGNDARRNPMTIRIRQCKAAFNTGHSAGYAAKFDAFLKSFHYSGRLHLPLVHVPFSSKCEAC